MGSEIHIELSVMHFKTSSEKVQITEKFLQFFKNILLNAAPTVMIYRQPVSYPEREGIRNGQVPLRTFSI